MRILIILVCFTNTLYNSSINYAGGECMKTKFLGVIFAILFSLTSLAKENNMENTLYLDLKDGRVVIELLPELAPKHVVRIKELVKKNFYDGIVFHRVIGGFMAQTGDPTGTGAGGSGHKLKAEFSKEPHVRGVVSMARSQNPDSADSQFFIVFDDARFLDGQYTVFGKVTKGMEFVDKIKKGDDDLNGQVNNPDKIIKMHLAK